MQDNNATSKYWFEAKRYGWGWEPATWQGWLITALYIVLAVAVVISSELSVESDFPVSLMTSLGALTFLFFCIAWRTGEPPRWQWGRKRDEK